jgi:hypothetical protein
VALSLIAPAAASAAIFVIDPTAFGGTGGVIRVDSTTGARTTVSENTAPAGGPSFEEPLAIALASNGDLLVADQNAFGGLGGVIRVDPATGARTTVSENTAPPGGPGFVDPFGITTEANGNILVSDQNAFSGPGGVIRVDPATGTRTTLSENSAPPGGPTFDAPFGIAREASGTILVADAAAFGGGGGIIRVDPVTGARTTVSENQAPAGAPTFSDPFGVAVEANGNILVADGGSGSGTGGVIRVNPTTGARTLVSNNASPPGGPSFGTPIGLGVASNGDILVADAGAFTGGGVIRVDPVTGVRTTVSENATPAGGPGFAGPFGLVFVPDAVVPTTLPPPEKGVSVNVEPVRGEVRVALPANAPTVRGGRAAQKGLTFVPLSEARQIPVGSFLDTKRGRVRLLSEAASDTTQSGEFFGGLFQVLQRASSKRGLTTLPLKGASFSSCRGGGRGKRASAARRKLSKKTVRKLGADATGSFRTRGRHSAATVRGTIWTTIDRCDGTLTRVKRGKVAVRDFRRKRTIVVKAGKRYLAKKR